MSDEQDKLKLSLEPPKLFGRKKKSDAMGTTKRTSPAPAARRDPADDPAAPEGEVVEETPVEETAETAEVGDTALIEAPEASPVEEEPAAPAPPEQKSTPAKAIASTPVVRPATKPVDRPAPKPARPRAKLAPDIEPEPLTSIEREDAEILARPEGPLLPLYPAAALTGAVVGAAMVVLTWLSLRGCEAVRGTASCGGGPGFLLLVATFVLCILLGSTLLKTFSIPDPGSSSFLAVGLVAVIALLFLIEALDHWSMLIVIPLISVGGFLASVWVTKTFVEPTQTEP